MSGGASLVAMKNARLIEASHFVSLARIEALRAITPRAGGGLRIGGMVTHARLAACAELAGNQAMLRQAAGMIANRVVRNMGTIGGAVGNADPAADYLPVLACAQAEIELAGPGGTRRLPVGAYLVDWYETALEPRRDRHRDPAATCRDRRGLGLPQAGAHAGRLCDGLCRLRARRGGGARRGRRLRTGADPAARCRGRADRPTARSRSGGGFRRCTGRSGRSGRRRARQREFSPSADPADGGRRHWRCVGGNAMIARQVFSLRVNGRAAEVFHAGRRHAARCAARRSGAAGGAAAIRAFAAPAP